MIPTEKRQKINKKSSPSPIPQPQNRIPPPICGATSWWIHRWLKGSQRLNSTVFKGLQINPACFQQLWNGIDYISRDSLYLKYMYIYQLSDIKISTGTLGKQFPNLKKILPSFAVESRCCASGFLRRCQERSKALDATVTLGTGSNCSAGVFKSWRNGMSWCQLTIHVGKVYIKLCMKQYRIFKVPWWKSSDCAHIRLDMMFMNMLKFRRVNCNTKPEN